MSTTEKVLQIEDDFRNQREPFDDVEFPEERLLETLKLDTDEGKLQAISLFATLDYNRNANQLVDKILELRDSNLLDPEYIASNEEYVRDVFDDVAFRYRNRDADAWIKNCTIITEQYNGKWSELLMDTGMDAPSLVQRLEEDDFSCLKGDKIAPMYARIIDDEVCELDGMWELDIPVDTWVRKISKEIFQREMSDDEIRREWRGLAIEADIERHIVDGGIWLIGNNFDEWGEEYLKGVMDTKSFKYL